jgi:phosphatidylglycerophosphatase A
VAPGTAGSVVGVVTFALLPAWARTALPLALGTCVLCVLGVGAASRVARLTQRKDPGLVVIDEVVGMWISLAFVPLRPTTLVAGFLLFRLMDIVKPYPARQLEALPAGWGIMADDVMAGIYANLVLQIALRVVTWP